MLMVIIMIIRIILATRTERISCAPLPFRHEVFVEIKPTIPTRFVAGLDTNVRLAVMDQRNRYIETNRNSMI